MDGLQKFSGRFGEIKILFPFPTIELGIYKFAS
jgi:hypothetical protein